MCTHCRVKLLSPLQSSFSTMGPFVYGHCGYFANFHLEWAKWVNHFERVRM